MVVWLWLLWKWGFYYVHIDFLSPLLFWAFKGFSVYGVSSHDVRIVNITDGSFMHSTIDLISSTDEFVFQWFYSWAIYLFRINWI